MINRIAFVTLMLLTTLCLAASAEPITIRYSSWLAPSHQEIEKRIIADFEAAHPEIDVQYEVYASGYVDKLTTMVAGGTAPDVHMMSWLYGPSMAEQGIYSDLMPYIQRDEFDLTHFFPPLINIYQSGTKQYGVPREASTSVLFYNVERFNERGLVDPNQLHDNGGWNWDALLEAAKKLTRDRTGDGNVDEWGTTPILPHTLDRGYGLWPALNGMDLYTPDRTSTNIDSEASVEALQWWSDFANVHEVSGGTGSFLDIFPGGQVGIVMDGGNWRVSDYKNAIGDEFQWDIVPWPQGPRGNRYSGIATGLGLGIWSGSSQKDAAWEFIKFYTGYESQKLIVESGGGIASYMDANRIPNSYTDGTMPHGEKVMAVLEGASDPWVSGLLDPTGLHQVMTEHIVPIFQGEIPARQGAEQAAQAVNLILSQQ